MERLGGVWGRIKAAYTHLVNFMIYTSVDHTYLLSVSVTFLVP